MRKADVIRLRLTPDAISRLDAKRGSVSREAWLAEAVGNWGGPGSDEILLIPTPRSVLRSG